VIWDGSTADDATSIKWRSQQNAEIDADVGREDLTRPGVPRPQIRRL